jgi:hypothetical protein
MFINKIIKTRIIISKIKVITIITTINNIPHSIKIKIPIIIIKTFIIWELMSYNQSPIILIIIINFINLKVSHQDLYKVGVVVEISQFINNNISLLLQIIIIYYLNNILSKFNNKIERKTGE